MNNILYKDATINYEKIANWEDKFIPKSIIDNIILSLTDHSKYQGYIYDPSKDNLKNDIYAAISNFWNFRCKNKCNKLQLQLLSGYIFSNIAGIRHHFVLKLISAIYNLGRSININTKKAKSLIIYSSDKHLTSLNN